MSILVTIGTTSWRAGTTPDVGEVIYEGDFLCDGFIPLMVWDDGLNNIRPMTDIEIQQIPQQQQAAKDAANPALAAQRDAAQANVDAINAFLANPAPTLEDLIAEVKAIDQRMVTQIQATTEVAVSVTQSVLVATPPVKLPPATPATPVTP